MCLCGTVVRAVPAFCIWGEGLSLSRIRVGRTGQAHGVQVVLSTPVAARGGVGWDAAAALGLTTACKRVLFVAHDGQRLCLQSAQQQQQQPSALAADEG